MPENNQLDFPFDEVVERAEKLIHEGATIFQKFSCENCGNRLTMEDPNKFYTEGSCDKCGHVTDIKATGCNYLIIIER